jgi:hypothetical protein
VIAALHDRFTDCVGPDVADICYATQNRQTAVRAGPGGGCGDRGGRGQFLELDPADGDRARLRRPGLAGERRGSVRSGMA